MDEGDVSIKPIIEITSNPAKTHPSNKEQSHSSSILPLFDYTEVKSQLESNSECTPKLYVKACTGSLENPVKESENHYNDDINIDLEMRQISEICSASTFLITDKYNDEFLKLNSFISSNQNGKQKTRKRNDSTLLGRRRFKDAACANSFQILQKGGKFTVDKVMSINLATDPKSPTFENKINLTGKKSKLVNKGNGEKCVFLDCSKFSLRRLNNNNKYAIHPTLLKKKRQNKKKTIEKVIFSSPSYKTKLSQTIDYEELNTEAPAKSTCFTFGSFIWNSIKPPSSFKITEKASNHLANNEETPVSQYPFPLRAFEIRLSKHAVAKLMGSEKIDCIQKNTSNASTSNNILVPVNNENCSIQKLQIHDDTKKSKNIKEITTQSTQTYSMPNTNQSSEKLFDLKEDTKLNLSCGLDGISSEQKKATFLNIDREKKDAQIYNGRKTSKRMRFLKKSNIYNVNEKNLRSHKEHSVTPLQLTENSMTNPRSFQQQPNECSHCNIKTVEQKKELDNNILLPKHDTFSLRTIDSENIVKENECADLCINRTNVDSNIYANSIGNEENVTKCSVFELPTYIVIKTKIVTKNELESNTTLVPSDLEVKHQVGKELDNIIPESRVKTERSEFNIVCGQINALVEQDANYLKFASGSERLARNNEVLKDYSLTVNDARCTLKFLQSYLSSSSGEKSARNKGHQFIPIYDSQKKIIGYRKRTSNSAPSYGISRRISRVFDAHNSISVTSVDVNRKTNAVADKPEFAPKVEQDLLNVGDGEIIVPDNSPANLIDMKSEEQNIN